MAKGRKKSKPLAQVVRTTRTPGADLKLKLPRRTKALSNGKHPGGRPSHYLPEFADLLVTMTMEEHYTIKDMTITKSDGTQIDKTEIEAAPPVFVSTFAKKIAPVIHPGDVKKQIMFIACHKEIFADWRAKYPEFGYALKLFEEYRIERIQTNGSMGTYNAAFAIFTLKNIAGWRDEQGGETNIYTNVWVTAIKKTKDIDALGRVHIGPQTESANQPGGVPSPTPGVR